MTLQRTHQFGVTRTAGTTGYLVTTTKVSVVNFAGASTIIKTGSATDAGGSASLHSFRGCELEIFSTGANNSTGNARIYRVTYASPSRYTDSATVASFDLLGTIAYTVGTLAPLTGDAATAGTYADTFAYTAATNATTPKGIGDLVDSVYANSISPVAYSPANDTIAMLFLPDFANGDLFIDFDTAAGLTTGAVVSLII